MPPDELDAPGSEQITYSPAPWHLRWSVRWAAARATARSRCSTSPGCCASASRPSGLGSVDPHRGMALLLRGGGAQHLARPRSPIAGGGRSLYKAVLARALG